MNRPLLHALALVTLTVGAHRAHADVHAEPPATPDTDTDADADAAAASLPDVSSGPALSNHSRGWYGAFGAGYLPAGAAGPGAASAELFETGIAFKLGSVDLRLGGILALESTYYQSSVSGLLIGRLERYLGSSFSIGAGFAFGVGSFSPTDDYNADNGASAELAVFLVPMRLHLGGQHRLELSAQIGTIYLAQFGESDPFYELSIGYVRW